MSNKFSLISLGCPKNLVDSDNLLRRFVDNGFSYIQDPENSDILLINTCGFIEEAKRESVEEILKLCKIKKESKGREVKGSKRLIVFGCLAQRYKNDLSKEIPEIDAIFGVGEEEKIIEYCKKIVKWSSGDTERQRKENLSLHRFTLSPIHPFSSYAYLKIADGCSKKCTYCVIPSIRGSYRSIAPESILKEAERLIKGGAKELILVAQDTACYGADTGSYDITSLLKDISSISGDFWIRLLYVHPSSINDSLLNLIAEEDKICKYLDIPLQHSENRILKLMGRRGSRKEYLNLVRDIRENIPDIALRTTFIVGFPSETKKEFESLLDFIEEIHFDRLGVFRYSKEEGTPASKLKGHIPAGIKVKRVEEIMSHQALISLEKNRELIGRQFRVIIDETSHGAAIGRLYSHAPEIDGVVIIESAKARKCESAEVKNFRTSRLTDFQTSGLKAGDFATVKITNAFAYDLKGTIVS